jgi:hypothetical protein
MAKIDSKMIEPTTRDFDFYVHSGAEKWGQPSASRYEFSIEGNLVFGSILDIPTSSDVSSNKLDSSVYFITELPQEEEIDDAVSKSVEFASLEKINEVSEYLLKKNAELYRRLAQ